MANSEITPVSIAIAMEVISGTPNFQLDTTYDYILAPVSHAINGGIIGAQPVPTVVIPPGLGPIAANTYGTITTPIQGYRLTVNSGAGVVQLSATQAGIRN